MTIDSSATRLLALATACRTDLMPIARHHALFLALVVLSLIPICGCGTSPEFHQRSAAGVEAVAPAIGTDEQGRLSVASSLGHSHNDYYRDKPLTTALDAGMIGIEADVILREQELFIGHESSEISPGRTLRALYLEPLSRAFEQFGGRDSGHPFGGRVREDGRPVILMVDFKSEGEESWRLLESQLSAYAPMLRKVEVDPSGTAHVTQGPVIVVVSGNRPIQQITEARTRFCGIDGRYPADAGSAAPSHLMPMISTSWSSLVRYAGGHEHADRVIQQMRDDATAHGRLARVWATPDEKVTWDRLARLHIQLINTDQPLALSSFLTDIASQHVQVEEDIH